MPPTKAHVSHSLSEEIATRLLRSTHAEVRFDHGSRALYASDLSHYRQVPIGVVIPSSVDDVVAAIAICREYGVPILSRGAGTSLARQTCNVAVVIDSSKYLIHLLEMDPVRKNPRTRPGGGAL